MSSPPSSEELIRQGLADAMPTSRGFGDLMREAMVAMDRGMKQAEMGRGPDRDFAAMMIPHHQGAIDMAKAVLKYGSDAGIRAIAQQIVDGQQQQIAAFEKFLGGSQ